jgi:uridine phosphorylase
MMDFFIREVRAIVTGPLHIIRFGSCGSLGHAQTGDMVVATNSVSCHRNYDYFLDHPMEQEQDTQTVLASMGAKTGASEADAAYAAQMRSGKGPYVVTRPVAADADLTQALTEALKCHVPQQVNVHQGLDITADSFYGSQARQDRSFHDANSALFTFLTQTFPTAECLQMETFGLLHLAKVARPLAPETPSIRAAACAMVFAHRVNNTWIDPKLVEILKDKCAKAIMDALVAVPLAKELEHPEHGSVWQRK